MKTAEALGFPVGLKERVAVRAGETLISTEAKHSVVREDRF